VLPLPRGEGWPARRSAFDEGGGEGESGFPLFPTPHSALRTWKGGEFTLSPHFVVHFIDPVTLLLHRSKTPLLRPRPIFQTRSYGEPAASSCVTKGVGPVFVQKTMPSTPPVGLSAK
jgi:hypothetical protein